MPGGADARDPASLCSDPRRHRGETGRLRVLTPRHDSESSSERLTSARSASVTRSLACLRTHLTQAGSTDRLRRRLTLDALSLVCSAIRPVGTALPTACTIAVRMAVKCFERRNTSCTANAAPVEGTRKASSASTSGASHPTNSAVERPRWVSKSAARVLGSSVSSAPGSPSPGTRSPRRSWIALPSLASSIATSWGSGCRRM